MFQAPKQDWAAYEALTQHCKDTCDSELDPRQRFTIYADLFGLITDGRRLGDWSSLNAWHQSNKMSLRQRLVDAYRRLDEYRRERSTSQDTD